MRVCLSISQFGYLGVFGFPKQNTQILSTLGSSLQGSFLLGSGTVVYLAFSGLELIPDQ